MNNIYEFNPVIYPYKIWVVINKNTKVILDNFNDNSNEPIVDLENNTNHSAAFAMEVIKKDTGKIGTILYFRNRASMRYELIAHESIHAGKNLFEYICADINPKEPFEYLVGWIAGCCEEAKRSGTKRIKSSVTTN